ncbi:GNAT family N-acetyltransferase [Geodermatophilus sp. SYSU D00779]
MRPLPAVTVRTAGPGDLADAVRLYRQLHPEPDLRAEAAVEAAWAATPATPGRTVLLAELGGAVVGTADLTVPANAARAGRPYLLVENVVVDAGARRAGVGRALLAAARAHGEAAGCDELQLSADDPEAFAFYEAAGLQAAARTYERYLHGAARP